MEAGQHCVNNWCHTVLTLDQLAVRDQKATLDTKVHLPFKVDSWVSNLDYFVAQAFSQLA